MGGAQNKGPTGGAQNTKGPQEGHEYKEPTGGAQDNLRPKGGKIKGAIAHTIQSITRAQGPTQTDRVWSVRLMLGSTLKIKAAWSCGTRVVVRVTCGGKPRTGRIWLKI